MRIANIEIVLTEDELIHSEALWEHVGEHDGETDWEVESIKGNQAVVRRSYTVSIDHPALVRELVAGFTGIEADDLYNGTTRVAALASPYPQYALEQKEWVFAIEN